MKTRENVELFVEKISLASFTSVIWVDFDVPFDKSKEITYF